MKTTKIYPYTTLKEIKEMCSAATEYAKKNFPTEACKNASVGARNNVFDKIATRYLVNLLTFPYSKETGTVLRWCYSSEDTEYNARYDEITIEEAMLLVSLKEW